jgi:hypothetical protein
MRDLGEMLKGSRLAPIEFHIDEQGAEICRRKNGVPAPRLGGIVQRDAGRIDRRVAHLSLLLPQTAKYGIWP